MNALRMHKTLLNGLLSQEENAKLMVRLGDEKTEVEQLNRDLEERVRERTRELTVVNQYLREDIVERKQSIEDERPFSGRPHLLTTGVAPMDRGSATRQSRPSEATPLESIPATVSAMHFLCFFAHLAGRHPDRTADVTAYASESSTS